MHFGLPPKEIKKKYLAACNIQALIINHLRPGILFKDICKFIKEKYKKFGYSKEWKKHFQGAITGYIVADPTISLSNTSMTRENQTYDWFITITGVKSEELSFLGEEEAEFISVTDDWPKLNIYLGDKRLELPDIMII